MKTTCIVLASALWAGTAANANPRVVVAAQSAAQKPQPAPSEKVSQPVQPPIEGTKPLVPLRVQIVLSRMKGEKKIASLPYVLGVTANDRMGTNLRMGINVPIARGAASEPAGVNYQSVGTNIDCTVQSAHADVFRLVITVEDSSVLPEAGNAGSSGPPGSTAVAGNWPAFRTFKSSFVALLRDGQTTQHTSAVDPISGEVMKIDVTLNSVK